ncbi:helix-turn-helix domain-containing protein [Solicola sp. PLA-1-18]|uniref:helix-turn-helix domain-containing protein n=1 Tax=Solicola sp. PLA-1-18 TaxID=3380532 RepID=UPI003B78DCCC
MAEESVEQLLATVERLRVREARLAALYATANDLTAIRDVGEILEAIVGRARQLIGTDISYLGLVEDDATCIRVTDGAVSASFRNLRMPLGTGLLGLVAGTGVPYATPDYHADERFAHREYIDDAVDDERIHAILGVPMKVKGEVIGALLAANRTPRPFSTEEVELLSSFAAHAAIALENARLFSEAEEATTRLAAHSSAMERAARAHDRLTAALVGGGDLARLAEVVAEDLDAAVCVLDVDGRVRAAVGTDADALPSAAELGPVVEASVAAGRSVPLGDHRAYVAAAAAGGEHLGSLVVLGSGALADAERRTLDRAALGLAVVLSFERTVAVADGRAREDLLDELLDGPDDVERARSRLRREHVDPDGPHSLLVAVLAQGDRGRARRRLDGWARARQGLVTVREADLVALVPGDDAVAAGRSLHDVLAEDDVAATVGAVALADAVTDTAAALVEGRSTARALVALGRDGEVADPAGLGFARLLLGQTSRGDVAGFVETTLGPLLAWDAERGTDLVGTVEAWCAASGSAAGAARLLHVHTNTVTQRLDRVASLIGPGWRDPAALLDVQLALRVWRMGTSDGA